MIERGWENADHYLAEAVIARNPWPEDLRPRPRPRFTSTSTSASALRGPVQCSSEHQQEYQSSMTSGSLPPLNLATLVFVGSRGEVADPSLHGMVHRYKGNPHHMTSAATACTACAYSLALPLWTDLMSQRL